MHILDHWHPVLKSEKLGKKAVEIEIAGKHITLFRNKDNNIAAINSRCPHRGMNLSHGKIEDGCLACPYHGWSFDALGNGKSPCNPKMKIKTDSYKVKESNNYIWITKNGTEDNFPRFSKEGFENIAVLYRRAEAPLEPVLDNFHEFEHFPPTHKNIGYNFKQITESKLIVNSYDDHMRIEFTSKENLYFIVRKLFNLPDHFKYFMGIDVNFSPVYSVYHQGWFNPENGENGAILINVVFFVPVNNHQTDIFMFLLTKKTRFSFIKNFFIKKASMQVIDDDLKILNNLSDKYMDLKEMKLSSYDKAIIEIRKRINSVYYDNKEENIINK